MWRQIILVMMCGLWYGLGYLSCEHCSELHVMSCSCLFLPKAKDVLTVRWLLLREKWHKSCPYKKCSAWLVVERVFEEIPALLYHSLLLMYLMLHSPEVDVGLTHSRTALFAMLGLLFFLLCFLWAPWTATCWKTGSCSPGGWPLSSLSVLLQQLPCCKVWEFQPVPSVEQVANSLLQLCKQTQIQSANMNVLQLFTDVGEDQGITLWEA